MYAMMSRPRTSKFTCRKITLATIAQFVCSDKLTNGRMAIASGRVQMLISNRVSIKRCQRTIQAIYSYSEHLNSIGKAFRETCSGHGKYLGSRCKCDKKFYGSRCQYLDECVNDQDCGNQGKCVDINGSTLPRRQCYCNLGWFGPGCNKSKCNGRKSL